MFNNKKARVFFLSLVIVGAMVSISMMYAGYRKMLSRHESYLAGDVASEVITEFQEGELWLNYIDYAARYALQAALLELPWLMAKDGCSTPGGIPIVKPDCTPEPKQIEEGLLERFDTLFKSYLSDEYIAQLKLENPPHLQGEYEYYFFQGNLHGVAYKPVIFNNTPNLEYRVLPSFSVELELPFIEVWDSVYAEALRVYDACNGEEDFRGCIASQIALLTAPEEEWHMIQPGDTNQSDNFARFVDAYAYCMASSDTNCYCELDYGLLESLHDESERLVFGVSQTQDSLRFQKLVHARGPVLQNVSIEKQAEVCNFHYTNYFARDEIRLRRGKPGYVAYELKQGRGWNGESAPAPPTIVKFEDNGNQLLCFLTSNLEVFSRNLRVWYGVDTVEQCGTKEVVYVRVKTQYKVMGYNREADAVEELPLTFTLAFIAD
ncbi:hypothetical protein DRJ48_00255 [Candidatus Woesearchaeota archaeon]|nr:hypothetical protein [Candidatus Woesearchaeota archaeon]RLE43681.1 MAG: hypothetical protein DRJ48_00255 [Candidatus Woesearchaeota archaeon]